jgi:thiol-disulfide isomerase/thioredoxin
MLVSKTVSAVAVSLALAAALASTACSSTTTVKAAVKSDKERKAAPEFALKDANGQIVHLSSYKGKVVLLDFWATWCEPCKIEIPWLIEFQRKYAAKDFVVLGVAMDEEGKYIVEPYLQTERFDVDGRQEAINYQILLGTPEIGDKFGINGYPTGVLISRGGHLISTVEGLTGHDALAREIEKLF